VGKVRGFLENRWEKWLGRESTKGNGRYHRCQLSKRSRVILNSSLHHFVHSGQHARLDTARAMAMEEYKLARMVDQLASMRRAQMASAFNVLSAAGGSSASSSSTASSSSSSSASAVGKAPPPPLIDTLGDDAPDVNVLHHARRAALAGASQVYAAPTLELPIDMAADEVSILCL
jgi:hypothetical protein